MTHEELPGFDLIYGKYESDKCPPAMTDFNVHLGASLEDARKKATKAVISFEKGQAGSEAELIYTVVHGDPAVEYKLPIKLGEKQTTLRSGKPVEVVYEVAPISDQDSVVTLRSKFQGLGNDLQYEIEYNFVENGFLLICSTANIRAKRWYKRVK